MIYDSHLEAFASCNALLDTVEYSYPNGEKETYFIFQKEQEGQYEQMRCYINTVQGLVHTDSGVAVNRIFAVDGLTLGKYIRKHGGMVRISEIFSPGEKVKAAKIILALNQKAADYRKELYNFKI